MKKNLIFPTGDNPSDQHSVLNVAFYLSDCLVNESNRPLLNIYFEFDGACILM
ncbi:hypothetical protein SAMN02745132_00812 [Enterovibrio nigricans DSM 22720]|uniref:Uncharacterized protein n=1 Tax=Enterovibrio nigricans DSM 22720 TaxID=1121868 RepID=A0A1T4U647_9GAMM|nr:hypothetical protein SAMN02745132_00812 [Enterovibrio nigricans DSM 22720]